MSRPWQLPAAALLGLAGIALAASGARALYQIRLETSALRAVQARPTAAVPQTAPAAVLEASARALIGRGSLDDAQAIADRMTAPRDAPRREALLYALGNARLHHALDILGAVPFRVVKPVIGLAKADYRQALQITPYDWDVRYNYALAASLLPDRELYIPSNGAQMSHDRAVWPDVPGAPNGMP